MQNAVLQVLQRASETIGPDLGPFKAIWGQWEARGARPSDKAIYLQAEEALKQALVESGEKNMPEFARSRDARRYSAALQEAIHRTESRGA